MFEIGASLREARIKRGLTPADVHKAIRIRDRYLQALEEERWELLPGDAYIKGFLRTYSDFLGLDAGLYIDEYNSRFARHEEAPLAPQPLARGEAGSSRGLARPAFAIAALLVVVAGVAVWQLNRSPSATGTTRTNTAPGTTGATTTAKKHHKHTTRPTVALPKRAVLVAARGNCWLEVRRGGATGKVLYENTLQQGQKLPLSLTNGPVWLWIGNPTSLDVHLGGKLAHGLPTQPAKLLLTRRGLKQSG